MRYSFRTLAASLALASLAGPAPIATAQQTKPTRPGAPNQQSIAPQKVGGEVRPVSQKTEPRREIPDPIVEKISPALQTILEDWEEQSSKIKSLHGTHTRTVYNLVFEEERVATGKFFLQTPDKGRIDLIGAKPKQGAKSSRLGKKGDPFRMLPDRAERWICTGDEIVMINDEEKTFEIIPLPEEAKGTNIINTPLPFLFGMKVDEAKRRFHITLSKDSKEKAILIILPRLDSDRQNYAQAFVILDKSTYLPEAVKLFDPAGSMETVYKFDSVKINDTGFWRSVGEFFGGGDKDPYRPELKRKGYKLVLPTVEETEPPRRNLPLDPKLAPQNVRPTTPGGTQSVPLRTGSTGANGAKK